MTVALGSISDSGYDHDVQSPAAIAVEHDNGRDAPVDEVRGVGQVGPAEVNGAIQSWNPS